MGVLVSRSFFSFSFLVFVWGLVEDMVGLEGGKGGKGLERIEKR